MKSVRESETGFTIIEVVLFLAISSLMIITAMTSVAGRTSEVQYTDSTRSVEAFLDRRVSQVLAGSITSENEPCFWNGAGYTSAASDGSCIFLGYLFRLDPARPTEIDVVQMYGARLSSTDTCIIANPDDPLFCASPTPTPVAGAPVPVETFEIPWGLEVTTRLNLGPPHFPIQYFGYLRNPIGQNLIPVSFLSGLESEIDNPSAYRKAYTGSWVGDEFTIEFCLTNGRKPSRLLLGQDDRQYSIEAELEGARGICP